MRPPLTTMQQTILQAIETSVRGRGYPPTIRELCEASGLFSTSSVAHQLRTLENKGYLQRDPTKPRALTIIDPDPPSPTLDESGVHLLLNRHWGDPVRYTCPGCGDPSLRNLGITQLAYTFEVCTCRRDQATYDHLIEQLWHRTCLEGHTRGA